MEDDKVALITAAALHALKVTKANPPLYTQQDLENAFIAGANWLDIELEKALTGASLYPFD